MVREDFEDLYKYMSRAEEALRCAYNSLIDYCDNLHEGLALNGETYNYKDIKELWSRLSYNRDRINNILVREINDKLSSM